MTFYRFGLERVTCSSRSPILGHGHCSPIAKQKDIKDVENKKIGNVYHLKQNEAT